jgi:hypothetical protein
MKTLLITLAALSLCGCISAATQRDGGVATYDAIQAASKSCAAKGGEFKLKRNGDAQYLEDYGCVKKKD